MPGKSISRSRARRAADTTPSLFDTPPRPERGGKPPVSSAELGAVVHAVLAAELEAATPTEGIPGEPTPEARGVLPARMINEFVYCPRLFFYEHVEGVFVESADTLRGKGLHARVDGGKGAMPTPEAPETIHARSVTLGSERLGVSARLDLVECSEDGSVAPVDYKAGAPREGEEGNALWPTDKVQLGLQMLLLEENGYRCSRGFIYYRKTKQRVAIEMTPELAAWVVGQVEAARRVAASGVRPPPLDHSPKCVRCSLAPVCLPDETLQLAHPVAEDAPIAPRRLMAAKDDRRSLYLNTQGVRVGVADHTLEIRDKDSEPVEIRLSDVHHVALFGNIQVSTQAIQRLCREEIPLAYFSTGGWFYGLTRGHSLSNILTRRAQFDVAKDPVPCLALARCFVAGKIRNSRTLLMRNASEQPAPALARLGRAAAEAMDAQSLDSLLGVEGAAAACYFSEFAEMLKPDDLPGIESPTTGFSFDFRHRNRRPPTDPVNALLSLAYSLLAKDTTVALLSVGFDPWMGFYHQPRPGRPALALDLMEEFRPLVAESAVITAINTRMVRPEDFVSAGNAVNLDETGRKRFFTAYEQRMNQTITHPLFGYKVCYRRAIELQARLLARALEGEISEYRPFLTR